MIKGQHRACKCCSGCTATDNESKCSRVIEKRSTEGGCEASLPTQCLITMALRVGIRTAQARYEIHAYAVEAAAVMKTEI